MHEAIERDGRARFTFHEHPGVADVAGNDRSKAYRSRCIFPGQPGWDVHGAALGHSLRHLVESLFSHGSLQGLKLHARSGIAMRSDTPSSAPDRKSTRLNSSHSQISYAVFCLKKKIKYN